MECSGSFWNFLVNDDYNIKVLATKLSPLLLLQCYNQVAKIVTLNSDWSVELSFLKCLLWIEMLVILVKIVEL